MTRILPPFWLLLFLATGVLLHIYVPASHVFRFDYGYLDEIVGGIVLVIGFFLPQWGSKLFAKEKTEILPTSPTNRVLIMRGPYRFSRNPMYLGLILTLLGLAIILGTLPMFAAALGLFLVLNFGIIPFEEAKMRRQFGEEYEAYTRRVRRWL